MSSYSAERIAEKIAIHDWMLKRADKRCSANPPGFLVSAIQEDFPAPTGFLKSREQSRSELRVISSPTNVQAHTQAPHTPAPSVEEPSKLDQQFEHEAIEKAEPFNQRFYAERKAEGGSLFRTIRRSILTGHFASRLSVV